MKKKAVKCLDTGKIYVNAASAMLVEVMVGRKTTPSQRGEKDHSPRDILLTNRKRFSRKLKIWLIRCH